MIQANIAKNIASVFGLGYWPKAPGTWASLYTAALSYVMAFYCGTVALGIFFLAACLLSLWSAEVILKTSKDDTDPSWVVIDEVAGQSLVFFYIFNLQLWLAVLAFVAFRFFDILKPWPISWIDRKFSNSFGILADDLAAGFFAGLVVFLAQVYL